MFFIKKSGVEDDFLLLYVVSPVTCLSASSKQEIANKSRTTRVRLVLAALVRPEQLCALPKQRNKMILTLASAIASSFPLSVSASRH
jgi:hypothetical protein